MLELNSDGNFSSEVIVNEKLPNLVCVNIFGEYVKARPYDEDIVDNYLNDVADKIIKNFNYDNKEENEE